jgi:hypothetical protein
VPLGDLAAGEHQIELAGDQVGIAVPSKVS